MQTLAEQKKMHEEAKALEMKKREDLRAEHIKSDAEVVPSSWHHWLPWNEPEMSMMRFL